ncbi:MAG TPA: helix-turn-helix transcriptional regulator [Candidatus Binatia bacterium]|nr:helix-turn-helix transcriptional regulator [Candidatus Binatia bacterium]
MATRTSIHNAALLLSKELRAAIGREIRVARTSAGLSQRAAGARVGMSHAQWGRIERAELEDLSVGQIIRACIAVGLKPVVRAVPGSGPALDSGQLAAFDRLRALLPTNVRVRTEVPLPIPGDLRAWDAVLDLEPRATPIEIEARLQDIQAVDRRCALKLRDSPFDRMVLLVSDTKNNRTMLDASREHLRASFPLDTRAVLRALRAGRTPEASGIVIL